MHRPPDVTINSHHAIRFTISTLPPTGPSAPTHPRGTELYGYILDDGTRSVEVVTFVLPTEPGTRAARHHIIDQAATTIRFTA